MPATTKTFAVTADARIYSGLGGSGAGKDDKLPVGRHSSGENFRSLVKPALPDWAGLGVRRIVSAKLRLFNSVGPEHVARGATPRVLLRRNLNNWSEGTSAVLSGSNGGGVTWNNKPATTTTGQTDSGTLPTADNATVDIDCTAQVRAWAPVNVESGGGQPNYGFTLLSFDEGSTTRTTEFWSRESSKDPVLIIVYETNTAPLNPINVNPGINGDGSATIYPVDAGKFAIFTGTHNDPDPGDYITGVEIQVYADSATDATPGAILAIEVDTSMVGTPTTFAHSMNLQGLTIGTTYRSRVRTRDKEGLWGNWSTLTASRFIPNTVPGPPTNLAVDTASATPNFYGSLDDPDPSAAIGTVFLEVMQDTPTGAIAKWLSSAIASGGTRFAIAYAGGQVLEFGIQYRFRAKNTDNLGSESAWSEWVYWTPVQVIGPDNMTPRNVETKQATVTPTLTIAHAAAFTAHELEVARFSDGTDLLWDVPITSYASTSSKAVTYAGLALDWGRTYWWRSKILIGGSTWSEWSPWYPFYINALPRAVRPSIDNSIIPPNADAYFGIGRYVVVATATPTIRMPFSDPDRDKGYTDNPTRRELVIKRVSDSGHVTGSPFVITSGITDTFVPGGGVLTIENQYFTYVHYDDSDGKRSDPDFRFFKVSAVPTIGAGAAPDVADPSPTLDWTFSSPGGKNQTGFWARVYENVSGKLVHDSGFVESSATDYVVPGEILADALAYRADVVVYDTDLLSGTLAIGAWTTAFTTPAVLATLTVTPDLDASAMVLDWSITSLSDAHFWRYKIKRQDPDTGAFEVIGEVAAKNTLTFTDKEAPHGVLVRYAVSVSNGWEESEQISATGQLDLFWWIVTPTDPGLTFQLNYVEGFRDREAYQQGIFEALGRDAPLVVSGKLLPSAGTLQIKLLPGDVESRSLIRRAALVDPWVVLKTPFGDAYRVKLGSIDRDRGQAGAQVVGVEYHTVDV